MEVLDINIRLFFNDEKQRLEIQFVGMSVMKNRFKEFCFIFGDDFVLLFKIDSFVDFQFIEQESF